MFDANCERLFHIITPSIVIILSIMRGWKMVIHLLFYNLCAVSVCAAKISRHVYVCVCVIVERCIIINSRLQWRRRQRRQLRLHRVVDRRPSWQKSSSSSTFEKYVYDSMRKAHAGRPMHTYFYFAQAFSKTNDRRGTRKASFLWERDRMRK